MGRSFDVSVVIPVYGAFSQTEMLKYVLAQWKSQTIKPEIVLSEQTPGNGKWKGIAAAVNANYIHSSPTRSSLTFHYNIGRVRNLGIHLAHGRLIYCTDADVMPLNNDFLEQLCKRYRPYHVYYRPFIYRILKKTIPALLSSKCKALRSGYRGRFCYAAYKHGEISPVPEVRRTWFGWPWVCRMDEYNAEKDRNFSLNSIYQPAVHWGGTFIAKDALAKIGGFSEVYHGWGCEDNDLHFKLASLYQMEPIGKHLKGVSMIHFEHPRYHVKTLYNANAICYSGRLRRGVLHMIQTDIKSFAQVL